jgi:hypothetical protein
VEIGRKMTEQEGKGNNVKHPTYKAFAELGKAIKTILL